MKPHTIWFLACLATQIAMGEPSLAEMNAFGNKMGMKLLVIGSGGRELALVCKLAQRTSCLSNLHQPPPDKPKDSSRKNTRDQS
jgi:hypothetical protein